MRIAFLYDRIFPESIGGVEHRNLELGKALVRRGHEVVIAGPTDRPRQVEGVEVRPWPRTTPWRGPHRFRQLLPWITAMLRFPVDEFDLVETANIPLAHLPILHRRCRSEGVPLLVTWYEFWGRYWFRWTSPPIAPICVVLERLGSRLGTGICATSGLTADRVRIHRKQAVPIVPIGIDVGRLAAIARDSEPADGEIVYAGRLIPEKRIDLLVRAVERLQETNQAVRLKLIGEGPSRKDLQRLVCETGISVRFLGSLDSAEDVWREIASAVAAVQPSEREGFGMFPLESMALGVPVIYCRSPESAVSEIVRDGVEGVAASANAESLAEAIGMLVDDRALRDYLAENARRRADAYDWRTLADAFEGLIGSLTNVAAPGTGRPAR